MSKKRKLIIILSCFILLLSAAGMTVLDRIGIKTPISSIATQLESNPCKVRANRILKTKKASYPFYRCELETYKVTGSKNSISRIYVVAGEVEERWEFECGFNIDCQTYVGWFDEKDDLTDFISPPKFANHDPAIVKLGCGESNTSSIDDVGIEPELVYEKNKFWWKINYNHTPVSKKASACTVTGVSLVGYQENISTVKKD